MNTRAVHTAGIGLVMILALAGCKVTVTPKTLALNAGATGTLSVTSWDRDDATFTWTSDNAAVATVASAGNTSAATVTAVANGTATITVTGSHSGRSDTARVTVTQAADLAAVTARFATSLHGTRNGKATWYNGTEQAPGFSSLANIPFDELPCMSCHAANYANGTPVNDATYTPGCADCHADPAHPEPVTNQAVCLGCHSRQEREIQMDNAGNPLFDDVHRNHGMTCASCHGFDEIHGDGASYASILESPGADCVDCHKEGGTAPVPPLDHDPHGGNLHCSACHVSTVISCYNCHFESIVDGHQKRPFTMISGFSFLVNNLSKHQVETASYQSVTYEGKKFVAIGPYYGHTVVKGAAKTCDDCHNNANVQTYNTTGKLKIATWNEDTDTLSSIKGIVPIPGDYKVSLKFDFLTYAGDAHDPVPATPAQVTPAYREAWGLVSGDGNADSADLIQMADGLVAPLTSQQMSLLSVPMGGK